MNIKLGKDTLHNIEDASQIEWMENNDLGMYAASTAIGLNTRREHGLFAVPDRTSQKQVLLLSKFEESVFIENKLADISTNEYQSGIFPTGYQYLESFERYPFPRYTYNVQGHIIQKTIFILKKQPLLIVRYELKNKLLPINLIIKPFLAERFSDELAHEMRGLNTDSYVGHHFVRWALKHELPELYIYFNHGEYVPANLWYKNFSYKKDQPRFGKQLENLFNPGFFQIKLEPYQYVDLYISTQAMDIKQLNYENLYRNEKNARSVCLKDYSNDNPQLSRLSLSLEDSLITVKNNQLLAASRLENLFTTRDILISLPGLFFVKDKFTDFKSCFKSITKQLVNGLLPVHSPLMKKNSHYCAADLSLWLINIGYLYFQMTGDIKFFNDGILESFRSIYENFEKGTSFNIYMERDGLIFAGDKDTSVSWIPLKNDDKDKVLRYGKMIEINALWYNAIMILKKLYAESGKKRIAQKFAKQAEKTSISFLKTFYAEPCVDFVNNETSDTTLRINQIVPLALPFSPIKNELALKRLEQIEEKLLTPYGLKTAEFDESIGVRSIPHRKSSTFYTNSIWPWSLGLYVSAALKWNADPVKKALQIQKQIKPLLNLVDDGLLGFLPEIVVNTGKMKSAGIPDFTPSASSVVWSHFLIQQIIDKSKNA